MTFWPRNQHGNKSSLKTEQGQFKHRQHRQAPRGLPTLIVHCILTYLNFLYTWYIDIPWMWLHRHNIMLYILNLEKQLFLQPWLQGPDLWMTNQLKQPNLTGLITFFFIYKPTGSSYSNGSSSSSNELGSRVNIPGHSRGLELSDSREQTNLRCGGGGLLWECRGGDNTAAQWPHGGHAGRGDQLECENVHIMSQLYSLLSHILLSSGIAKIN